MVHVHYGYVYSLIFQWIFNKDVSGGDKEEEDNDDIAIPLLMRNALPDVQGYEKNEKIEQVSIVG